jgi:hypothetical protein
MNLQHSMPIFVQCHCTSLAAQPAAAVLHPCRPSPPDRRGRSRPRSGKTEGKIKGPARSRPEGQSARGLGAARRPAIGVPSLVAKLDEVKVYGVPSSLDYASLRWSGCHGLA